MVAWLRPALGATIEHMATARHRIHCISVLFVLCGFLATGCDQASPSTPTVALDQQFVLKSGELASIAGTGVRVQFVEVVNDSRCPLNATCITAGDALIAVAVVDDQGSSRYELHTDPNRKSATHRDLRIELVELQPYPDTSRRIDPSESRATLRASRK
jgi:hypothetical protein